MVLVVCVGVLVPSSRSTLLSTCSTLPILVLMGVVVVLVMVVMVITLMLMLLAFLHM